MRPDALTTALRGIVAGLMNLDEGNRFFGEMMSGITTRYELGEAHPLVGRICGNLTLVTPEGERQLPSLMLRGNGLLVDAAGGGASEIASKWADRVRSVQVREGVSMLLRPDACIAWACDDNSVDGLESVLEHWFGRCRVTVPV
jgi:hypothetical protein